MMPNQFDLDMLRVTIEVGRDLDELMQMIGVARSDAYRMLEVPAFSPPLLSTGGLAVKLWGMPEKRQQQPDKWADIVACFNPAVSICG